jgi:hypothetical protein
MRRDRSIPPLDIMELWLGRDFALEFIAVGFRSTKTEDDRD